MRPFYKHLNKELEIFYGKAGHEPPHIHTAIECVYVRKGALELGIGQELNHMNTGDFAIVFPNLIHHYQVFDPCGCIAMYLFATPAYSGMFANAAWKIVAQGKFNYYKGPASSRYSLYYGSY